MPQTQVVLCQPVRTAIGTYGGTLKNIPATVSEDIVNIEGGAIAHGHPIGASGAVLTTRILHSMRRDGLARGVVTLCIGGGQGIALALEMLG
jgi:acetyl-CoA acetyltransferase